jgi:hypothetical protein
VIGNSTVPAAVSVPLLSEGASLMDELTRMIRYLETQTIVIEQSLRAAYGSSTSSPTLLSSVPSLIFDTRSLIDRYNNVILGRPLSTAKMPTTMATLSSTASSSSSSHVASSSLLRSGQSSPVLTSATFIPIGMESSMDAPVFIPLDAPSLLPSVVITDVTPLSSSTKGGPSLIVPSSLSSSSGGGGVSQQMGSTNVSPSQSPGQSPSITPPGIATVLQLPLLDYLPFCFYVDVLQGHH